MFEAICLYENYEYNVLGQSKSKSHTLDLLNRNAEKSFLGVLSQPRVGKSRHYDPYQMTKIDSNYSMSLGFVVNYYLTNIILMTLLL